MTTADPYAVLGVPADASVAEIRQAYLRLARRYHPDSHLDAAPAARAETDARMRQVNDAWAVLGDAERKRAYDASRPRPFRPFTPSDEAEPDPRDQPDVPYRPGPPPTTRSRLATTAPAVLFGVGAAAGGVATVTGGAPLVAFAGLCLVLSGVGFVVVPLLALDRARRDEG